MANKSRWYVGLMANGKRRAFQSTVVPTDSSVDKYGELHSKWYGAVIGPFQTKRAALWAESQGSNPHFQTVADAERISRRVV